VAHGAGTVPLVVAPLTARRRGPRLVPPPLIGLGPTATTLVAPLVAVTVRRARRLRALAWREGRVALHPRRGKAVVSPRVHLAVEIRIAPRARVRVRVVLVEVGAQVVRRRALVDIWRGQAVIIVALNGLSSLTRRRLLQLLVVIAPVRNARTEHVGVRVGGETRVDGSRHSLEE
jgi:hypothetical protein